MVFADAHAAQRALPPPPPGSSSFHPSGIRFLRRPTRSLLCLKRRVRCDLKRIKNRFPWAGVPAFAFWLLVIQFAGEILVFYKCMIATCVCVCVFVRTQATIWRSSCSVQRFRPGKLKLVACKKLNACFEPSAIMDGRRCFNRTC